MSEVIVALDISSEQELDALLEKAGDHMTWVKVGMQLYYANGPQVVHKLKDKGYKIFLDLKIHDIPNTARGAVKSVRDLGVDMLNFHCAGGLEMLKAVRQEAGDEMILVAVTQLTSTSEEQMQKQLKISGSLKDCVLDYAAMAKDAGLDGIVCSAQEVIDIKERFGKDFVCVCPGIRPSFAANADQKRVMTPAEATRAGADYLVIGRAITQAENPTEAINLIRKEMEEA